MFYFNRLNILMLIITDLKKKIVPLILIHQLIAVVAVSFTYVGMSLEYSINIL